VVVLPVGSTEQHGYHLPLDVDTRSRRRWRYEAARRDPESMLVLPPVAYGYTHHVMDFPGTINIEPSTFVSLPARHHASIAYHGFRRIVIVNGHGSNHPLVEQVGRQTNLQTTPSA
jgi:creatinine amidohydrolase